MIQIRHNFVYERLVLTPLFIVHYYVFFVVAGTVKPFRVSLVKLVDYLLGKTIYDLFNSIFKSCKYKSIAKQLNTKIELSDGFKKIADGRIKYEIYLTKFGTYGSYKLPNKIYLNVLRNSIDEAFHTLLHEMIHLKVEGEVIKKNLSHKEKEALVENLEKEFVE